MVTHSARMIAYKNLIPLDQLVNITSPPTLTAYAITTHHYAISQHRLIRHIWLVKYVTRLPS